MYLINSAYFGRMKIALIGYMGAGKSSVSQILSKKMKLDFIDLDHEIEKHSGYTITETIFNKGELYFRKLEREILEQVLTKDNFVLSTGGGTPCYYDNMDFINANAASIYINVSISELYDRLEADKDARPLIAHLEGDALKEFIAKHLFERRDFYERAIFSVKADGKSTEELTEEIRTILDE